MGYRRTIVAVVSALYIVLSSINAFAISDAEKTFLSMYFKDEELVVLSATRSFKSITRIAENVEVITKEDIELMNAHTVADVLRGVPGVAVYSFPGTVGSSASTLIQGSDFRHVAFFMDGIQLNTPADNAGDPAMIPAQIVDRIEIVKGPGSSAWGSSLGGVVNIITKTPGQSQQSAGTVAASLGERKMRDLRVDLYGKKSDLGYYLYAGHLGSDGANGLVPNSGNWSNNFYTKLTYDISKDTSIAFSLAYMKNSRGKGEFADFDYSDRDRNEMLLSTLALNTALSREIKLGLSIWTHRSTFSFTDIILSTGDVSLSHNVNHIYGGNIKIDWNHDMHKVVAGIDLDTAQLTTENVGTVEKRRNKFGIFINDTIELDKLSLI
ncbi:MAG: TonB-dependent receptor plug domain-containing protein, partial [Nitrospirae bacterium]|nr:TonB-dependent receptor plug domain-containing protein [Nitrospirota bacterium]